MRRAAAALAFVVASGGGCAVGPAYKRPPVALPAQVYGQAGVPDTRSLGELPFWDLFQDESLRALIEEALRAGYDVRIAAARVDQARARFGIARAAAYPQVGYEARYARQHTPPSGGEAAKTENQFAADVNVSWELDLWGRVRRLKESARAQYLASEEARRGVMLSLVAEVASAYFELRELDAELEHARAAQQAFQDTFELFNRRLEGGAASALETSRAEAELANVSAQIPSLEQQVLARENQLSLLLGRPPGPIARGAQLADQPVPPELPAGLPSALLARRPDLLASEQRLIAATADVGVARAAFFPTLSLTGALGGVSSELEQVTGGDLGWRVAPSLLGPLFQGGRIRRAHRLSLALLEEARLRFEQDVNRALGEVSTSLYALQKLEAAEGQRRRAVAANENAARLSRLRYTSGLSAYFEVLDAQQQLLQAQNGLAQTRRDQLVALARFYEALGGGWRATPSPAAPPGEAAAGTSSSP